MESCRPTESPSRILVVDEEEFRRRIDIYLQRDLPEVQDRRRIAEVLGRRLFQYVRQNSKSRDPGTRSIMVRRCCLANRSAVASTRCRTSFGSWSGSVTMCSRTTRALTHPGTLRRALRR